MHLSKTNAEQLIAIPKSIDQWSGFTPRSNHAGHIIGIAQLIDSAGIYLPGLTLEIEVKAPIVTAECLIQYSIRQRIAKNRLVVYQLEVCPKNKRSHNGVVPIYGPHEHIGDSDPNAVNHPGVDCDNWHESLSWFLKRINSVTFNIDSPC